MLKQPKGIVKLTNASLVKYKVKGKIYELICFKNKIMDWRNGNEKDIENVLQSQEIFTDAIKGEKATKEQLNKHFPAMTRDEIIAFILEKGMTQISDLEREHMQQTNIQELIHLLSQKIVHPVSKRRFSEDVLNQAIKMIGFNVRYDKNIKAQLSKVIKELETYFKIERAKRLYKIRLINNQEDFIQILKEKFSIEILKQGENWANILLENYRGTDFEAFLIEKRDQAEYQLLDMAYHSQEQSNSEDTNTEFALERTENPLPNQTQDTPVQPQPQQPQDQSIPIGSIVQPGKVVKVCSHCIDANFTDMKDFKEHIQTDWHKFNLKAKMVEKDPISYQEFQELQFMQNYSKSKKQLKIQLNSPNQLQSI